MTRQYPTQPIVGVGGVVIDSDRVLLVKRAHAPLAGEWSLPGGGVELGERLQAAVAREVREETGVDVVVGPVVGILDRIHRGDDGRVEYHFVIIDYLCTPSGGSVTPQSDAADARWVPTTELDAYRLTDTARQVIAEAFDLARRRG
jgi:mutator protein MutT